jgi:hypothetical protein
MTGKEGSNRPNCSKSIAIIAIGKSIYLLFLRIYNSGIIGYLTGAMV